MAQDIIDGINPTRMELLSLKNRTKLAVKGHGLLKEKRDALIKEFFDILDRVKGIRENAELSLKEANDALVEAQIAMGDLAVRKASLSVKESIDVDIASRSVMGVAVPVTNVKMEERSIIDRGSVIIPIQKRTLHLARKTRGESDYPGTVFPQYILVYPRLIVKAFGKSQ